MSRKTNNMVLIKRCSDSSRLPIRATKYSAGLDLFASAEAIIPKKKDKLVETRYTQGGIHVTYGIDELNRKSSKVDIKNPIIYVSASRKSLNASQKSQERLRKKKKRKLKQEKMA